MRSRSSSWICLVPLLIILTGLILPSPTLGAGNTAESDSGQFLYLEDIESGMSGIGKTVVKGSEISTFSVRVIGVIDKPGHLEDFIIVRASGAAIEESGGISQGMSGSPVYIDDKLIGAISRAALWSKSSKNPIALITPIGTMFQLMNDNSDESTSQTYEEENVQEQSIEESLQKQFPGKKITFKSQNVTDSSQIYSSEDELVFVRKKTPIFVNNFSNRSLKTLKHGINTVNEKWLVHPLKVLGYERTGKIDTGLSSDNLSFHNLQSDAFASGQAMKIQPGGPFGVSLIEGDISLGSLGTVTYTQNDELLGFGHHFILNGDSDFILNRANVFDTIKSYEASFKLGALDKSVGSITQDRMQGVLGEIGNAADLYDAMLTVSEVGSGSGSNFQVSMVKTSNLIGVLSLVSMQEAIDKTLNRIGPGTGKVEYEISGINMPKSLKRTDIFFSTNDVAQLPSLQIAIIINALALNPFKEPGLTKLTADFTIDKEINGGQIIYFALGDNKYNQGDLVAYEVKIKNYRDDIVRKTGAFRLPEDLPTGDYVVSVYGGPRPSEVAPPKALEDFDDLVTYIENLKNYEHLSVELLSPLKENVVPAAGTGYRYESVLRIDQRFPNKVIYGRQAISIDVVEKKSK